MTIYVLMVTYRLLGVSIGGLDIEVTTEAFRTYYECSAAMRDTRASIMAMREHPDGIAPSEVLDIECRPLELR